MKQFDLTGQRFTRLVALRPAGVRNGRTLWTCKCDCGNEIVAQTVRLRNGGTRSCGCLRGPKATADITGQRFGHLVAVKQVDQNDFGAWIWECDCDCGGWTEAIVSQLRQGQRTCCGQGTCPLAAKPRRKAATQAAT